MDGSHTGAAIAAPQRPAPGSPEGAVPVRLRLAGTGSGESASADSPRAETAQTDGCSGGMDALARWWNKVLRRAGDGRLLAFTGCCDEHDLFYEQGGTWRDRAFADKVLRRCIAENLKKRRRSRWVRLHVPWVFWGAVRCFGWLYWAKSDSSGN